MKIQTKAPNFVLTKEINENTNKSTKFWLKLAPAARPILAKFSNINRMITYTNIMKGTKLPNLEFGHHFRNIIRLKFYRYTPYYAHDIERI